MQSIKSMADVMKALQERRKESSQLQKCIRNDKQHISKSTEPNSVYDCSRCQDQEGYIVRLEDGSEVWRRCECYEKKRVERLFKYSRISSEFRKLSFDNFRADNRPHAIQEMLYYAEKYVEEFTEIQATRQNSIALLGQPGSGKTHLLVSAANQLLMQGIGVLYFPWIEGMSDLKSNFDLLDKKIQQIKTVPVLFIDDLLKGRRIATDWQLEQLAEVIEYRYFNHLPMLITSEKDIDNLIDIDEGIGSRIYEMSKDFTVTIQRDIGLNYRFSGEAV